MTIAHKIYTFENLSIKNSFLKGGKFMKTPAQKVIYSLLTLILLLSIGSGVVATNGNRTELINPELDNELSEETLKIIPIEDTLDYALYEQADKLSKSFIN